ncbi:thioesterase family protein [Cytophagaceae bacterium DM2B3-1]|uniref:Thioesterase family protein n=1 Tax=Xanthocytophaga flava TaxID=3048013 RepID=A0ABT7CWI7_9BACT|nr:thioesterase family protein [Xanthocytophaga flavus]MDJ1496974.1 thioesterase family protein [Xanthocytophaga flavus]
MLSFETEVEVKFSEVDSLHIVWHGHYVRYFEDAREGFGKKYGLHYLEVYQKGFVMPIVKLNCDYKRPLVYGDIALVKITYVETEAAKVIFQYEIKKKDTQELIATGETIQVFLDTNRNLCITVPDFLSDWKTHYQLK